MERRPRPPGQPILTGGVLAWLVSVGLVMAIGTLSVVSWAEQAHTLAIARTMGVVVFSLFNLFFSLESRDRRDSVFSLSTFADRTCIVTTGASLFLLVMATVLAPCHAILKTTALDVDQWLLCAAVALSIIAITEIRKAFLRQTVGPIRLRRSPPRRQRHRCRASRVARAAPCSLAASATSASQTAPPATPRRLSVSGLRVREPLSTSGDGRVFTDPGTQLSSWPRSVRRPRALPTDRSMKPACTSEHRSATHVPRLQAGLRVSHDAGWSTS